MFSGAAMLRQVEIISSLEAFWETLTEERRRLKTVNEARERERKKEAQESLCKMKDRTTGMNIDGILYKQLYPGDEEHYPRPGHVAKVHYTLRKRLQENQETELLNTFKLKTPFEFVIGGDEVIEGWNLVLPAMSVGERALFEMDAELCYGSHYHSFLIEPGSTLIFEIELIDTFV